MSEERFVYWVGDLIQIDPNATRIDGSSIDADWKGDNYNWFITEVDPPNATLTLGAYRAFGLRYRWSPPIVIHEDSVSKIVKLVCRHTNAVVDPKVEPTCLEDGVTEGKHCPDCGEILIPQKKIPKLQHEYVYDMEAGVKTCTKCKHQIFDSQRLVDLTGEDIRKMIQIIEAMLAYDSSSPVPPEVVPEVTPPQEPQFDASITFTSEWKTDLDLPYLLYTPSSATTDGTTPLIVWLHGSGECGVDENTFRNRGLPAVMQNWSLQGFNAYILCPRLPGSVDWTQRSDSVFSMISNIVTKYQVDTRKIVLMGHSLGGIGTEYIAFQKPRYFSCQIIMSGYSSGVDLAQLRDLPTRIYAENEQYAAHYTTLKNIFGDDACTVLNCSHGEVPSKALNIADTARDGVSDLLYWALSQTNELVEDTGSEPEQPELQVPFTTVVTTNNVNLRTGPGEEYSIADSNNKAHAGQQLTIVEIVQSGNYNWGKLDPNIWKTSQTSSCISSSERWIALEYTTALSVESFETPEWIYPLSYLRLSSPYGYRTHPISGEWKMHWGVDLGAYWGTPIYATKAGTVSTVAYQEGGAGKFICVTHEDGTQSDYFHLEEQLVSVGDKVEAGQHIGRCGSTGGSTGPHLHFQIWEDGKRQDPANYIDF